MPCFTKWNIITINFFVFVMQVLGNINCSMSQLWFVFCKVSVLDKERELRNLTHIEHSQIICSTSFCKKSKLRWQVYTMKMLQFLLKNVEGVRMSIETTRQRLRSGHDLQFRYLTQHKPWIIVKPTQILQENPEKYLIPQLSILKQ